MIEEGLLQEDLTRRLNRKLRRFGKNNLDKITSKVDIIKLLDEILEEKEDNFISLTDAYKYSHCNLYPENLTSLTSYLESRGGKFEETVFFGLQHILKKYFVGEVLSLEMIEDADKKLNSPDGVFGKEVFPKDVWLNLLEKHNGKLPIEIRAVLEGEVVPVKNVLMVIQSLDEEFAWLTNFIESLILQVWYPITVATLSREVKKIVYHYLKITGTSPDMIPVVANYVLCDFGFRGVSSVESASIGGASHLVNFDGSDNVKGSELLMESYHASNMLGKSVIATEHSIMTIKGVLGEYDMLDNLLSKNPTGIVACVGDSYDIVKFVSHIGDNLLEKIINRDGKLVIRPDSGDIHITLKKIFEILFDKFSEYCTHNTYENKIFKVLPPQLAVLQGDGVNYESIGDMYEMLYNEGVAAENLVLGMGGKLLQADLNRDTQKFAIKACEAIIDGKRYDVIKSPMEFDEKGNYNVSFKKSKKGLPKLIKEDGYKTLIREDEMYESSVCELVPIFRNGDLLVDQNIYDIRKRAML